MGYQQSQKRVARVEHDREFEDPGLDSSLELRRKPGKTSRSRAGEMTGVVAEIQRFRCRVLSEYRIVHCRIPAGMVKAGSMVVGDRVAFDMESEDRAVLRGILPRDSKLARLWTDSTRWGAPPKEDVLAANVDLAVIVASAAAPPFHPRLIDRYLILCQYGDVEPLICVNKMDLADELPDLSAYPAVGIPVVFASAKTGEGLQELRDRLEGKFSVFTGQSGVGKSSLINRLVGEELLRVADVRDSDGRGRHTTTSATLNRLDQDSYIIDTPGIRSLGLWNVDSRSARFYFPEFEEFSPECRFSNCLHVSEPDCGVKEAVERGEVPELRYDSYLRLVFE